MSVAPLRVLIVDDELPARNRLRDLLGDCASTLPTQCIGEAADGPAAIALAQSGCPDVILLDIQMPGINGLEVARHLAGLPNPPAVIFTTAYDHYAMQAFDVSAVDYLLKPVRVERLLTALQRARRFSPDAARALVPVRSHFTVTERDKVLLVPVAEVLYLRAELKYVQLRTGLRSYWIEDSLTHLEQEFGEGFLRIHRAVLVARAALAGIARVGGSEDDGHWVALLHGLDEQLPVSRRQLAAVKAFARVA